MDGTVPVRVVGGVRLVVDGLWANWVKFFSAVVLCWLLLERVKSFTFRHHLL